MDRYLGAVEAGGTKFVCAVGTPDGRIVRIERFPTTTPAETLGRAGGFFQSAPERISALGIGAFGPLDLDRASTTHGYITATPKPGWSWTDVVGAFRAKLPGIPIAFDTDVNAAGMGEARWGAARGLPSVLYLTIGTGVGGGFITDGRPLHGLVHPEMGHILLPGAGGEFAGVCPFHGSCFEGLASGPAIAARWGQAAETLPPGHPAWEIEAEVIAAALAVFVCTLSPHRIVLGGGVMEQGHLFAPIRAKLQAALNGYVQSPEISERIDSYVVPPGLGDRAGIVGALALAVA